MAIDPYTLYGDSMQKTFLRVLLLAGLVLGAAACGDDGEVDREATIEVMAETSGISTEQAACVYDQVADEIDPERLADPDATPTDDELALITEALAECIEG